MGVKRQRPSADQWATLDTALNELRSKPGPPTSVAQPLSHEIARRADAIRELIGNGWRVRDLAAFFRESAGIDISATTIQTAL